MTETLFNTDVTTCPAFACTLPVEHNANETDHIDADGIPYSPAEAKRRETAAALVATIKGAVNGLGKYAAYVAAHGVTKETVKDHAATLAALAYPNDKPVQTVKVDGTKTRTRFGNAVQAAAAGLRNALDTEPTTTNTDWLAKIVKDAEKAIDAGVDADAIRSALASVLTTSE